MSTLKSNVIEPATGTTLSLGAVGDNVTVSADSIQTNLYKDAGGNTIFQSDGAGTLSNVNSGIKGAGPHLILSQTASASSSISFTSDIDSTYDTYMFVFVNINPATDDTNFQFNVSDDTSSWVYDLTKTTLYFRAVHTEDDSTATLAYDTGSDLAQGTGYQNLGAGLGNGADESLSGILYLYAPSSTTYIKNFWSTTSFYGQQNAEYNNYIGGYVNVTAAVTAIDFKMNSGNIASGTIKMYGCI